MRMRYFWVIALCGLAGVRQTGFADLIENIKVDPNPLFNPVPLFMLDSSAPAYAVFDFSAADASAFIGCWARVDVDGASSSGPLGALHRSFAQGGEDPHAKFFEELSPFLKELGARLVRTDPLGLPEAFQVTGTSTCRIDWNNADRIIDALKAAGALPLFNLTTCPDSWKDKRGWPTNLEGWRNLVTQAVKHFNIERKDHIQYWELWNEPNQNIKIEEYLPLYQVTVEAIRAVDPSAKVGGPAAAALNKEWLEALLQFCRDHQLPLDFISWHDYTIPPWAYRQEAREVRELAKTYFPERKIELVLSEWNINWGEVEENDTEVCGAHALTSLLFMRGSELDIPMFFEPRDGWDWKGPDRRYWHRWGLITNKLDRKAGFYTYSLWNRLGENTVPVRTDMRNIWAMATSDNKAMRILVWNYETIKSPPVAMHTGITLQVRGIPFKRWRMNRALVDSTHSNSYHDPARDLLERVETWTGEGGQAVFQLALSPYAATLLEFEPLADGQPLSQCKLIPGRFELYGGLHADIPITVAGPTQAAIKNIFNRDGIPFTAGEEVGGPVISAELPVVKTSRYVSLHCDLKTPATTQPQSATLGADLSFLLLPSIKVDPLKRLVDVDHAGGAATLSVALTNLSPEPLPLVISATMPQTWWGLNKVFFAVPAQDRVQIDLPVRTATGSAENPQLAAGVFDVPVSVALQRGGGEELIDQYVLWVGVPGVAVYRNNIMIDGELADWQGVPPIKFNNPRHPAPAAPSDLDPTGYLAWNEKGLYLAADIIDNEYKQEAVGMGLWGGDSICFGMDLERDADGLGTFNENDFEWGVALTANGLESFKWASAKGFKGGPFEHIDFQIKKGGGWRRYEIFVPWSELRAQAPRAGHRMGISFSVNDHDTNFGGTQDWGNPITRQKNPAGLVPVILMK